MSTLAEIEIAVDALPPPQQKELLRRSGGAPEDARSMLAPPARWVPATGTPILKRKLPMPSMPIDALLDVNVIIASVYADHVMHGPARSFVEGLEYFHTTPMTQGGFLRFATRRRKNERKEEQPPRLAAAGSRLRQSCGNSPPLRDTGSCRMTYLLPNLGCIPCKATSVDGRLPSLHLTCAEQELALASLENRMANLDDLTKPVLFVVE